MQKHDSGKADVTFVKLESSHELAGFIAETVQNKHIAHLIKDDEGPKHIVAEGMADKILLYHTREAFKRTLQVLYTPVEPEKFVDGGGSTPCCVLHENLFVGISKAELVEMFAA